MPAVRSVAKQLAALFDKTQLGVYVVDERRAIIYCNPSLAQWMGTEVSELVGRQVEYTSDDHEAPPGVSAGLCPPPQVFTGQPATGHVSCLTSGGRLIYRLVRFEPLGTDPLNCLGVVAFVEEEDLSAADLQETRAKEPNGDELHHMLRAFRAQHSRKYAVDQLLGECAAMQQVRARVKLASRSTANVIISGPPGTGKGHIARTIHYAGAGDRPVVSLNGGLLNPELLGSAILALGHDSQSTAGATVLLTGIDQVDEAVRYALAQHLDSTKFPLRVLATSQVPPSDLVANQGFASELALQLGTLEIVLPPLTRRLEDLPLLIQSFVEAENVGSRKQLGGASASAIEVLSLHLWPGNLDELREVVAAAHAAAEGPLIEPRDLPPRMHHAQVAAEQLPTARESVVLEKLLAEIEIDWIKRALQQNKGNKTKAAEWLGMNRPRFYRRLVQLGLEDEMVDSQSTDGPGDEQRQG